MSRLTAPDLPDRTPRHLALPHACVKERGRTQIPECLGKRSAVDLVKASARGLSGDGRRSTFRRLRAGLTSSRHRTRSSHRTRCTGSTRDKAPVALPAPSPSLPGSMPSRNAVFAQRGRTGVRSLATEELEHRGIIRPGALSGVKPCWIILPRCRLRDSGTPGVRRQPTWGIARREAARDDRGHSQRTVEIPLASHIPGSCACGAGSGAGSAWMARPARDRWRPGLRSSPLLRES